jgi:hypothetical protein
VVKLKNKAYMLIPEVGKSLPAKVTRCYTIYANVACIGLIEGAKYMQQRTFAGSRCPYYAYQTCFFLFKIYPLEYLKGAVLFPDARSL